MPKIISLKAREVLDSRGNPTIEVDCWVEGHILGRAAVPSGASTGIHEALELRDNDPKRYLGKGVLNAVDIVNTTLQDAVKGMPITAQNIIDKRLVELDGTPNKSRLGANAILGASMAIAKAGALTRGKPLYVYIRDLFGYTPVSLPVPLMNILNGGAHADNNLSIQEFMIAPIGASNFKEGLRMGSEIFHHLKSILKKKKLNTAVGDEGGFAPDVESNETALQLLVEAIEAAGYKPAKDVWLALDCAASSFYKDGEYQIKIDGKEKASSQELINWYEKLVRSYPIFSIEDGLSEEDWEGWQKLTKTLGQRTQIVGDDLFVTQSKRLQRGIEQKAANSILIKLNQVGTVSETLDCIRLAKEAGLTTVVSHRSGETEDTMIADLAVGTGAGQIKTGSLCRMERIAKYNQLLRIEEHLGSQAYYFGQSCFKK